MRQLKIKFLIFIPIYLYFNVKIRPISNIFCINDIKHEAFPITGDSYECGSAY
ncbi:hypothetical protein JCM16138_19910 [Thermococcus atlanticus]